MQSFKRLFQNQLNDKSLINNKPVKFEKSPIKSDSDTEICIILD